MSEALRRQLAEMHQRLSERHLKGTAEDAELTDRKQRLIVEGASRVLFDKGFHGASMRDIASACGMSFGQLYHYISSKDDILYLIHKHSQEAWYEHLQEAEFEKIEDPVDRLEHALRLSIDFVYENRKMYLFLYTESKYLEKEHLKLILDMDAKNVVGFYRLLLSEIPDVQRVRDDDEVASNLIPFLTVFLALRGWNLNRDHLDQHVDSLIDFVFRGLGLAPPPRGAGRGRKRKKG